MTPTLPNLDRMLRPEYEAPYHRRRQRHRRLRNAASALGLLLLLACALYGVGIATGAWPLWVDHVWRPAAAATATNGDDQPQAMAPPGNAAAGNPPSTRIDGFDSAAAAPAGPPARSSATSRAAPAPSSAAPIRQASPPARIAAPAPARQAAPSRAASASDPLRAAFAESDHLLASGDVAGARARLEREFKANPPETARPELLYRLGNAAAWQRDEADAVRYWKEAVDQYPASVAGRYAALALADRAYGRHAVAGSIDQTKWEEIWDLYGKAYGGDAAAPFPSQEIREKIRARCAEMADGLLFGPAPLAGQSVHTVRQGEYLGDIARKNGVHYESIARTNRINPNHLKIGMNLKIVKGNVSIVVRKNTAHPETGPTLSWFFNGRLARVYPACVGEGRKTPPGDYVIKEKMENPPWTKDGITYAYGDPVNILGTRWLGLEGMGERGLGIHGTTVPETIPGYSSDGCVRLHNRDVEELFGFARIGDGIRTRVTILD